MVVRREDGFVLRQSFEVSDAVLGRLLTEGRDEALYINVHSADFPGGEVRGQLEVLSDDTPVDGPLTLGGLLSGDQEVPPADTDAGGETTVRVTSGFGGDRTIVVEMTVTGLGIGPAAAMHIHGAPAGSNGGVILNLDPGGALRSETPADLAAAGIVTRTVWTGSGENERIEGTDGIDIMAGRGGRDVLKGGDENDALDGGSGKDKLLGGNGDDELTGGDQRDVLKGGRGSDVIVGGEGSDVVVTGGGRDTVVLDVAESGVDSVRDFSNSDTFAFVGDGEARVRFASTDAGEPSIGARDNAIVLTGARLSLEEALEIVAASGGAARPGAIVFADTSRGTINVAYSDDLSDAAADAAILAQLSGGAGLLGDLSARSFAFDDAV